MALYVTDGSSLPFPRQTYIYGKECSCSVGFGALPKFMRPLHMPDDGLGSYFASPVTTALHYTALLSIFAPTAMK